MEILNFLITHWPLTSIFLAACFLLFSKKTPEVGLSPNELVQMINTGNVKLIDVRAQTEYQHAHILSAIHCSNACDLQNLLEKYRKKLIVLVCNNGRDSLKIYRENRDNDTKLNFLDGGLKAWRNENLPVKSS